ncbi:MAG: hypothetical protein PVH18_12235, partial [Chloroflexota bacterium]
PQAGRDGRLARQVFHQGPADTVVAPVIPSDPPVASKISFGPLNDLGEATVTGEPGAVLPSGHVLLINLDTTHQDYVIAEPDGSFSAKIFAPPGSNIMVKHGPDHKYWTNTAMGAVEPGYNIFPSTTIYRPFAPASNPGEYAFASAGSMDVVDTLPSSVGAAWSMTGTVSPVSDLQPGDMITVEANVRLYSQAISATTDVSTITLQMDPEPAWLMIFDKAGTPLPYMNQAGSNRLTPSGFPILDSVRSELRSPITWDPVNWQYAGGHMIEGDLTVRMSIKESMPAGVYRPLLSLEISGVPKGDEWRAALVSWRAGLPSFKYNSSAVALPPLTIQPAVQPGGQQVHNNHSQRLIWYLGMDHPSLGERGTGAVQDRGIYQPASLVTMQGAAYVLPAIDPATGTPAVYRLEPTLPMISHGRGPAPSPPLLPFDLPGGQLCVVVHEPDGQQVDLGCAQIAQSRSGDPSTALGEKLNLGAIEVSEYYSLMAAGDGFAVSFVKPGYHQIEMTGWVDDVWGNHYEGGGIYEVWVAQPLDIDPGILPGTPLAVGDPINPTIQLNPRVPAYVNLLVRHFPYSDPSQMEVHAIEGWANRFGTFVPEGPPIRLTEPGEYRLDLFAEYVDPQNGEMYAAGATWGGVVMTPPEDAQLVAHGRRGSDNFTDIPDKWFLFCDENLDPPLLEDGTPHLYNPYLNGDILWSYDQVQNGVDGCLGDALMLNASVQDTVGTVQAAITERFERTFHSLASPGSFEKRVQAGSLPLFSSTSSGRPVSLFPQETDQIAYTYFSSQRPGVRVRESVAEEPQGSGYWRVNGMYDNQPGVGVEGDLPDDFKFQYVGIVYQDLVSGVNEYLGQGSGWFHLPYSDTTGSRVMPPFSGSGNGGWPTDGGPLLTLKGQPIDMFIMPTGVRPGAIMQLGERFDFAGHLMPTLDSRVLVTVTAPSGAVRTVEGRANPVGYFYDPQDGFALDEAGRWTAQVKVWHDGQIGSGELVNCDPAQPFDPSLPCPSGDVLGSADGSYSFYVVPISSPRLEVNSPQPGKLVHEAEVAPIVIDGTIPQGTNNAVVDYVISMPGFILEEGQAQIDGNHFSFEFDPQALNAEFPNIDLNGRDGFVPGLSDTFSIAVLLSGENGGLPLHEAATVTIQGDEVYVENGVNVALPIQ